MGKFSSSTKGTLLKSITKPLMYFTPSYVFFAGALLYFNNNPLDYKAHTVSFVTLCTLSVITLVFIAFEFIRANKLQQMHNYINDNNDNNDNINRNIKNILFDNTTIFDELKNSKRLISKNLVNAISKKTNVLLTESNSYINNICSLDMLYKEKILKKKSNDIDFNVF